MSVLYIASGLFLTAFLTWVLYLAIMSLKANQKELTPTAWVFAYAVLFIGYPMDVLMNLTVGSVVFAELPHELLFTSRCKRHLETSTDWQYDMADWWCKNFLDPFDTNNRHCK